MTPWPLTDGPKPPDAPAPTLTQARRTARALLGPQGRIWRTPDGWALGVDRYPGRAVLVAADTLAGLWGAQ